MPNEMQKMIDDLNLDDVTLLIIDEISQLTPTMLAMIDNRLEQAKK